MGYEWVTPDQAQVSWRCVEGSLKTVPGNALISLSVFKSLVHTGGVSLKLSSSSQGPRAHLQGASDRPFLVEKTDRFLLRRVGHCSGSGESPASSIGQEPEDLGPHE